MNAAAALELLGRGDAAGALTMLGAAVSDEADTAVLVARGMVQLANDHPAEALTAAAEGGETSATPLRRHY